MVIRDESGDGPAPDARLVSEKRSYQVLTTEDAKAIAALELVSVGIESDVEFGLPEVDDRYHVWRVPLVRAGSAHDKVGEIVVDARTSEVQHRRSTEPELIAARLAGAPIVTSEQPAARAPVRAVSQRNMLIQGDSELTLAGLEPDSVQLVFTSPPYFNARPDYTDYVSYEDYLQKIRAVIGQAHRVLEEGRFFVMNVAPVLIRRASRSQASRRIAVPFDMHALFMSEGFEFIDDIIWEKPEGAGWATGRGRRFAADRNPLQYKAVPVTEYVLVYRKQSDRLIDWHIRNHPDPASLERSRIEDGYERTNVWRIAPSRSKLHPAVFPVELAARVIRYYSFEGDTVLDPFAGIGTVGEAAVALGRRFVLAEQDPAYVEVMREAAGRWLGAEAGAVECVRCEPLRLRDPDDTSSTARDRSRGR